MVTQYDKAIASVVGVVCSFLAAKWAGANDPTLQAAIVTIVTTALVFFVPNLKKEV